MNRQLTWELDAKAHLAFILRLLLEGDYRKAIGNTSPSGKNWIKPVIMGVCIRRGAQQRDFLLGSNPIQGLRCTMGVANVRLTVPIDSGAGIWLARQAQNFRNGTYNYRRNGKTMEATIPVAQVHRTLEEVLGIPICFGPKVCKQLIANIAHKVASDRSKKRALG